MKIKISFIALFIVVIITSLYISSCKDDIENLIEEDPHEVKLEWTGYYNFATDRLFSWSLNSVKYLYDEKRVDSTFAAIIENSTVGRLSLEMLSIRLGSKQVGEYAITDSSGPQALHFTDFTKPAAFPQLRNGNVKITKSATNEELEGSFKGWGLSGADTMFIEGFIFFFCRKKL